MKCSFVTERLLEYRNGELPREQAEAVEQHLSECPKCREYADWFVGELAALRDHAPRRARLEDDFASHVIAGLLDTDVASLRRARRRRLVFGATAGIAAAAVILLAVLVGNARDERRVLVEGQLLGRAGLGAWELSWRDDTPLPEGVETVVPDGTPTTLRLGAGKTAFSEGATKLRYESDRIDVLAGSLRIESSSEASRIRATVPGARLRVRPGAAARVRVPDALEEAEGAPVELTVLTGAVDLELADGTTRVIRSRQRAVLGSGEDRGRFVRVDADLGTEASTEGRVAASTAAIPEPQRRLAIRMLLESLADGDPAVRQAALRTVRLLDSVEAAGQVYSILLESSATKDLQLEALETLAALSLSGTRYAKFSPRFLVDLARGGDAVPATVSLRAGEIGVLLYPESDVVHDYLATIEESLVDAASIETDSRRRGLNRAFELPERERSIALTRAGVDVRDEAPAAGDVRYQRMSPGLLRRCVDFERDSAETILWMYRDLAGRAGRDLFLDVAFAPADPGRADGVSSLAKAVAILIASKDVESLEGTPGRAAALHDEAFEMLERFVAADDTPDDVMFPLFTAITRLRELPEDVGITNGPSRDAEDALLRTIATDRGRWSSLVRMNAIQPIEIMLNRDPVDVETISFFEGMLREETHPEAMLGALLGIDELPDVSAQMRDLALERVAEMAGALRTTALDDEHDATMLTSFFALTQTLKRRASDVPLPRIAVDGIRDVARSVVEEPAFEVESRQQALFMLMTFPTNGATPLEWLVENARSADPEMRRRFIHHVQRRIEARGDTAYQVMSEIASEGGDVGVEALDLLLTWELSKGDDPIASVRTWIFVDDEASRRKVVERLGSRSADQRLEGSREALLADVLRADASANVRAVAALALLQVRARDRDAGSENRDRAIREVEILSEAWRVLASATLESGLAVELLSEIAKRAPIGMPPTDAVGELLDRILTRDLDDDALVVEGLAAAITTGVYPSEAALARVADHPGAWWWSVLAANALRASRPDASPEIHARAYAVLERVPAAVLESFRRVDLAFSDFDPRSIEGAPSPVLAERWSKILPTLDPDRAHTLVGADAHLHEPKPVSSIVAFREYLDLRDYYHSIMLQSVDSARGEIRAQAARMMLTEEAQGMPFTTAAVRMLSDRDESIRETAFDWLQRRTGETFGYRPDASPEERDAAIDAWRAWWARSTEIADPMTRIFDAVSDVCR